MRISKVGFATLALALLLVGGGTVRMLVAREVANTRVAAAPAPQASTSALQTSIPTPTIAVPERDVAGEDISGLPRFPGATRVEYRRAVQGRLVVTEVEYVTAESLGTVHEFYREVFREEAWSVADLGFSQGERTFFVLAGPREAVVEIEARGPIVEVEIELSEPLTERTPATATAEPTPSSAPTPTMVPTDVPTPQPPQETPPTVVPPVQPAPALPVAPLSPQPAPPVAPPSQPPPNPQHGPVPAPPDDDDSGDDDGGGDDGGDDD